MLETFDNGLENHMWILIYFCVVESSCMTTVKYSFKYFCLIFPLKGFNFHFFLNDHIVTRSCIPSKETCTYTLT